MAKQIEFDEEKYLDVSNDASASVFGYLFQAKAALWLFLRNIRQAETVKVETKKQDIEILCSNGTVLYAQAKAQQSYSTAVNEKQKLKSALMSLSKTKVSYNDELIYVSNLASPLWVNGDLQVRMNLIKYINLSPEQKRHVDESIEEIINSLEDDLNQKKDNRVSTNDYKNKLSINKLKTMQKLVEGIDKNKLVFSSIYPCSEADENALLEEIRVMLGRLDIDVDARQTIKIYDDWTKMLTVAEQKRDIFENENKKVINKSGFSWSIASKIMESSFNYDNMVERRILREISSYKKDIVQNYIEAGLFVDVGWTNCNKVINDFEEYNEDNRESFDRDFIAAKWKNYINDFSPADLDDDIREALTRYKLFQIISKHTSIINIQRKVGLPYEN